MHSATLLLALIAGQPADPKPKADPPKKKEFAPPVGAFKLRSIGPAVTSGRIVALAVNPKDRAHYFAATVGGVWKTTNAGTTFQPVFDGEGSYSIGAVAMDPKDANVVWVGTGENNSQRSVGYGDGLYKSVDGGKSWKKVGLEKSEHIARIVIHPKDSDTVYVAAQGPLWGPGGDRGLYKTTDGGKNWTRILNIDDNTGVTDVVMDPRDPDILVAASYQRRRHVWTLVNGGPGSGMHRSTDGGKNWTKITSGLPGGEIGRIGLAMAPTDPDIIYAQLEAAEKNSGIYRSRDNGKTWEKRNPFDGQAQYFCAPVVDPVKKDRLYIMNVYNQVSDDGGATLKSLGEADKHVDSHAIWIDPRDPKYYLCGCDGGLYESHDAGKTWRFKANLPITQFYDLAVDQNPKSGPFYHVYGGTQDNYTLGGPVRTRSNNGITNADWYVVLGGDGFHCKVDPTDPNTVYAAYQYGNLHRFDRATGTRVDIKPQEGKGEPPLRWNWDSPLAVSHHDPKRVYFAANILFRSDDRGENWKAVSPDLSRQLDRDKLKVFGKILPPETVAKNVSTSFYGGIVAFAESFQSPDVLYVGTDDGLIQTTEDGGKTWRKTEKFAGVPDNVYVSKLIASQHDAGTVYAMFDNHKNADFKPYLLKSTDFGKTWKSAAGDLPARGTVYCLAEDDVNKDLLFCGTEFGLYCTADAGKKWHAMKNGLPTVQVKDLAIQKHNSDLVVATFGRGFYVVDDFSPLRKLTAEALEKDAVLIAPERTFAYVQSSQLGGGGKSFQGSSHFYSENSPFGATFTVALKESLKTKKQLRKEKEAEAKKAGKDIVYPTPEELRAEAEEEAPTVSLTITDGGGAVVNRLSCPTGNGVHRVTWNLREFGPGNDGSGGFGFLVVPGKYKAQLSKRVGGQVTPLGEKVEFTISPDPLSKLNEKQFAEIATFQKDAKAAQRLLNATAGTLGELTTKVEAMRKANKLAPTPDEPTEQTLLALTETLRVIRRGLEGDQELAGRNYNVPTSTRERLGNAAGANTGAVALPSGTSKASLAAAREELTEAVGKLRAIADKELPPLEKKLDDIGAPWTPGRLPKGK